MPEYVIDYPPELDSQIDEIAVKIEPLWVKGDFQEAEKLFRKQYELIRSYEDKLPKGQRHHKGAPLHNWGIAILLQKDPKRTKQGYRKILLAYIEDLLSSDSIKDVQAAPAYRALISNPYISEDLVEMVHAKVEKRKRKRQIPKNPEDVLTLQLSDEAQHASEKLTANKDKVVFVAYGRNLKALDSMYAFLRSVGLHPLTFDEAVFQTGKSSPYPGEILDTAFSLAQTVVVLMTPDDEGRLHHSFRKTRDPLFETQLTGQARLNVVFEAGMAMGGHFRDKRTVLVELGELRPFSDIGGRFTVRLDNSIEKREDLINRLRIAGCTIDLSGDTWRNAGDFESVVTMRRADPLVEGRRLDPRFDHIEAWLFYGSEISYEKGERDPRKNNPRKKLVLNTRTMKAYYVDDVVWTMIYNDKIRWHSEDEQDLQKWCDGMGYKLIKNDPREVDLLNLG